MPKVIKGMPLLTIEVGIARWRAISRLIIPERYRTWIPQSTIGRDRRGKPEALAPRERQEQQHASKDIALFRASLRQT
jgi:hypothetical protein